MDKIISFTITKSKECWKGYNRQLYDVAIFSVFVRANTFVSFFLLSPRLPLNSMIAPAGLQLVILLLQHTKCQYHKPHPVCLSFLVCIWSLSSGFTVYPSLAWNSLFSSQSPSVWITCFLSLDIFTFFFNMPHR